MVEYTDTELKVIKQCKEGPFYTKLIDLTQKEYNDFIDKLIEDDKRDILIYIIALYKNYNCEKIFDYFLEVGDANSLVCFLNTNHDFTGINDFSGNYTVSKLKKKASKDFIQHFLEEESELYFLSESQIKSLKEYINER